MPIIQLWNRKKRWGSGNALITTAVPAWRSFTGLRISLKKKN